MRYSDDPDWTWRYEAKCRGEDTEMFFPPRDKALYKPIADKAKAICWGKDGRPPCPVRKECWAGEHGDLIIEKLDLPK